MGHYYYYFRVLSLLLISYQVLCILMMNTQATRHCVNMINNEGKPILSCDNRKSNMKQPSVSVNDNIQPNDFTSESYYANDNDDEDDYNSFRQKQSHQLIPDDYEPISSQDEYGYLRNTKKRGFVRIGKRGFVRIGKRGFVRIGR
uniref:Uncharacterized protein n=1 Tax=Trichobilharzia regenti TaxID=157069 RepID=A0AA85KEW4_TRIRE|nr:unnamed protein product [Trichobilharzia regenti]